MIEESPYNPEFFRLLDAVLKEPEKVPGIVKARPSILEEHDPGGETALHWLVIEDKLAGVELLRSLGAKIPPYALLHAAQLGYTSMVIALLEMGADAAGLDTLRSIDNPIHKLPKKKKRLIKNYLSQYGYET